MVQRRAATATANLDAPSREEIEASRTSHFAGRISARRDLVIPPAILSTLRDLDGNPLQETELFPLSLRPSNTLPDWYSTYMTLDTLQNYVADAIAGTSLMTAHDTREMPVGRSFDGRVEIDEVTTPAERAAAIEARGGVRFLLPSVDNEPLAWLFADFYMQRGLFVGAKPNDELIRAILGGTLKEVSIGFVADVYRCSICHLDIYDWDWDGGGCPHIPGVIYDLGDLGEVMCLAAVEGGHLLEVSLVYKGATPGAEVVETKARMVAHAGRLTSSEARQLSRLEAKLGQRLVDLSAYRRATSKTISARGLSAPASTKEHTMPLPKNITKSGAGATTSKAHSITANDRRAPKAGKREDTPAATDTSTATALEGAVADLTTASAESLAGQVDTLSQQIAASEAAVQGLEEQLQAAQAADPPDQATIDSLSTQLQAEQDNLAALQQELETVQAELDAVNTVATDVGGTPAEPSTDAGATMTGTQANTATADSALVRANAFRQGVQRVLAPLQTQLRQLTQDEAQPVLDALDSAVQLVNGLITSTGANAARSAADQVIFSSLARSAGVSVEQLRLAHVHALIKHSAAGRQHIEQLQEECVAAQVRALGAEHVDEAHYRRLLATLDVNGLRAEIERNEAIASQLFTAGRKVYPVSGTGSVELTPLWAGGNGNGNEGEREPVGALAVQRQRNKKPILGG